MDLFRRDSELSLYFVLMKMTRNDSGGQAHEDLNLYIGKNEVIFISSTTCILFIPQDLRNRDIWLSNLN